MAIFPLFRKKEKIESKSNSNQFYVYAEQGNLLDKNSSVSFKGEIVQNEIKFPKELGEQHPFDFSVTEGLYKKFGLVTGVVDKHVDFIVGGGFYVQCDNPNAKTLIEQFMQDMNFDTLLRTWIKEALIKGNGYLEIGGKKNEAPAGLKPLDAKYMYVKRDNKGKIEEYNQYFGKMNQFNISKVTTFKPHQIAHLKINCVSNDAYGIGIIQSSVTTINNMIGCDKDMHTIVSRKANSPYHVIMGDREKGIAPPQSEMEAFGKKLEWLNNKHEWVTGPYTEIKAVDFGSVGDKFEAVNRYDLDMLIYAFQTPEVILGKGKIPQGIAKMQKETWMRHIASLQAEVEKVIENDIFKRVLQADGMGDVHVEFEWGSPDESDANERIEKINETLKNSFVLSPAFIQAMEQELARLYKVELPQNPEMEKKAELEQEQPKVPGSNRNITNPVANEYVSPSMQESMLMSVREWVDFNYERYMEKVLGVTMMDNFENLQGFTTAELSAGKFSGTQVNKLREVLIEGFRRNKTLGWIVNEIQKKVKPQNLYRMKGGELVTDADGNPILRLGSEARAPLIARTETVRLSNRGAIVHFKEEGVEQLQFVSSMSERTCPLCSSLNGRIFNINEISEDFIPEATHPGCRCTLINVR